MPDVITAYRFDSAGYYRGTDPVLKGMLPDDDTEVAPRLRDGYWCRWTGSAWEYEKIPTTAEELVGMEVAHEDHGDHAEEVRELMSRLASEEEIPGSCALRRDPETKALSVVRIPDLTAAQKKAARAAEVRAERDRRLSDEVDSVNAVRWAAMTEETRAAWIAYRQALLDLPQEDGFPWKGAGSAPWPTRPE